MSISIAELISQLGSADESARRYAVEDLGDTGAAGAIAPLSAMLQDASAAVREAAIDALVRIGGADTVRAVLPALSSDHAPMRNAACVVLERIGECAVQPLAALLSDERKDVRKFAVDVLAAIGNAAAHQALIRALQDTDANVAIAAAEALGRTGDQRAVAAMARSLKANTWMRCAVAKSLGCIGGDEAVRILTDLLGDSDDMVVFVAIQALGAVGDELSLQYMLHLLGHANPMIVEAAIAATEAIINRTAPQVWREARHAIPLQPVVALTAHAQPAMRRSAAALLGKIGNGATLAPLVVALAADQNRDEPEVRQALADAILSLAPGEVGPATTLLTAAGTSPAARCELIDVLGRLGKPEAFEAVAQMTRHEDHRVRRVAARCLGSLDAERAGPVLRRCLGDRDGHVRAHAVRGLGALLSSTAVPALTPLLADTCQLVRAAAAWAVATIGGDEVIDCLNGLVDLLQDPYPDVRAAAAEALARIGSPAALAALLAFIQQAEPDRQLAGIRALAAAPPGGAADDALRDVLATRQPAAQVEALRCLAARGAAIPDARLAELLSSDQGNVRRAAVKLLSQQAPEVAFGRLATLLEEDADPRVRSECAHVLGGLTGPQVAEVLVRALAEPSLDSMVAIGVIEALGATGDAAALAPLSAWLGVDDAEVVEAALAATQAIERRTATGCAAAAERT